MSRAANSSGADGGEASDPVAEQLTGVDVAVIAVAAPRARRSVHGVARSSWMVMEAYAALVRDRTAMRALPLPLSGADVSTVIARITALPARVAAVFVLGLGPSQALTVQTVVARAAGPLVISELDVVTAALAAATVTTLRRQGVRPRQGRIVVSAPAAAPRLGPVLIGSGGGKVDHWHGREAQAYPLERVMRHRDVLIDLAGTVAPTLAPGRTLRLPSEPFAYGALVLPGLLSALCGHGVSTLTTEMLAASAQALALVTPADRVLPDPSRGFLVPAVTRYVGRTLTSDRSRYRLQ